MTKLSIYRLGVGLLGIIQLYSGRYIPVKWALGAIIVILLF